jgi:hypothetical protein
MRKLYNRHSYSRLEWSSNGTLQLQRLAHEELGLGTWSGCTQDVPTTCDTQMLGVLDIADTSHPVFKSPYTEADVDLTSSDESKEKHRTSHVEDTQNADAKNHSSSNSINGRHTPELEPPLP